MRKGKMVQREVSNNASNLSRIEYTRRRDGVTNSKSDDENSSANSVDESQPRRRRYLRHTQEQIQELEAFFKECAHPTERQRVELSRQLGMEPRQVKFWFQNKKTQMKAHHEHTENNKLRAENDRLRAENLRFKEAVNSISCLHCRVPTPTTEASLRKHQLRLENSRLRQEMDHISCLSSQYIGKRVPMESPPSVNLKGNYSDAMNNGGQRSVVVELAMSAMEELMMIAQLGEPLWIPSMEHNSFVLNEDEYLGGFSRVFRQKTHGFKFEASRESVIVATCAANIVDILMDVKQWENAFSGVVSRARNLQVISDGQGGTFNEAILVVNAEFHVPSPFVPTRESYFLRYCKQHADGIWAVADVSLNHLQATPSITCRRRPSGCLIQDLPNGHSKVIWVEHVEVEDGTIHNIYKPLITSGLAFGARRWVAILDGYCQRLLRTYSTGVHSKNTNNFTAHENQVVRKSMLKLAQRMVKRFCCGVNTSIMNPWTTLPGNGNENVKFMTRTNVDDPTMPIGVLLTISSSLWLPIPHKRVFDFVCENNTRKEWDILLNGREVDEIVHIGTGREDFNHVKLYQVKGADSSSSKMTILQETISDPTASYIVYSPIDVVSANTVLGGEDPSNLPLLPSGFAILPDGPTGRIQGRVATQTDTGGSLLTVAFQILIDSTPHANISMGSITGVNTLLWSIVNKIKQALIP